MRCHQHLASDVGLTDSAVAIHNVHGIHQNEAVTVEKFAWLKRKVGLTAMLNVAKGSTRGGVAFAP